MRTSGSSSDAHPSVISTALTIQQALPARPPPPHPQTARQRSVPAAHSPAARAQQVSPASASQQSAPGAGGAQPPRALPSSRHSYNAPQAQRAPQKAPRVSPGERLSDPRAQLPTRPTPPAATATATVSALRPPGAPVALTNMTFVGEPQGPSMGHAHVPALNLPEVVYMRVQITSILYKCSSTPLRSKHIRVRSGNVIVCLVCCVACR